MTERTNWWDDGNLVSKALNHSRFWLRDLLLNETYFILFLWQQHGNFPTCPAAPVFPATYWRECSSQGSPKHGAKTTCRTTRTPFFCWTPLCACVCACPNPTFSDAKQPSLSSLSLKLGCTTKPGGSNGAERLVPSIWIPPPMTPSLQRLQLWWLMRDFLNFSKSEKKNPVSSSSQSGPRWVPSWCPALQSLECTQRPQWITAGPRTAQNENYRTSF